MLKTKSALVSDLPSDEVYKFFNLWVGNGGSENSKNIKNPVVCFKVENSWIKNNNIDQDSITLNRYNDTKWDPLLTSLSGKDDTYLYFIAETPEFSPFVITGKTTEQKFRLKSHLSLTLRLLLKNHSTQEPFLCLRFLAVLPHNFSGL